MGNEREHDAARESDAEAFEDVKERTLAALKRADDALARGETFDEMMYAAAAGMKTVIERVALVDLKELGVIEYEGRQGRVFRQWAYRHRSKPDRVYCIGWQHRYRLQAVGYTEMEAFEHDPGAAS